MGIDGRAYFGATFNLLVAVVARPCASLISIRTKWVPGKHFGGVWSPILALFGHASPSAGYLLSGVKMG